MSAAAAAHENRSRSHARCRRVPRPGRPVVVGPLDDDCRRQHRRRNRRTGADRHGPDRRRSHRECRRRPRPTPADAIVDAKGLVLAPGFIDIHNHSTTGLDSDPAAETQVAQGITTLVVGADGSSPWPIAGYLADRQRRPAARQRHGDGRTRDGTARGHGRRLQASRARRRDRAHGRRSSIRECGKGRSGSRAGSSTRSAATATTTELIALAKVAGQARRLLHEPYPRRGGPRVRGISRGHHHRRAGARAGADLAHQAGNGRRLASRDGGRRS